MTISNFAQALATFVLNTSFQLRRKDLRVLHEDKTAIELLYSLCFALRPLYRIHNAFSKIPGVILYTKWNN